MDESTFGDIRALLEQPSLDVFQRAEVWSLIEQAATKASFRDEMFPYIESKLSSIVGTLAVVRSVEEANAILPFATFEQSLVPSVEACVKSLQTRDPVGLSFERREPRPLSEWRDTASKSMFHLEPVMLDLYRWCDGFTLEWLDDLDQNGEPLPEDANLDCTFRRLTLFGVDAYLGPIDAERLPEADAELDMTYVEFCEAIQEHLDESIYEDDLEPFIQESMRLVADLASNSNDLTCANIRLDEENNYRDVDGEWEFTFGERTRTLQGCTSFYLGSMIVEGQEFTLCRDMVDSEIAEVVTTAPTPNAPISTAILATLTHCFSGPRPGETIIDAIEASRRS